MDALGKADGLGRGFPGGARAFANRSRSLPPRRSPLLSCGRTGLRLGSPARVRAGLSGAAAIRRQRVHRDVLQRVRQAAKRRAGVAHGLSERTGRKLPRAGDKRRRSSARVVAALRRIHVLEAGAGGDQRKCRHDPAEADRRLAAPPVVPSLVNDASARPRAGRGSPFRRGAPEPGDSQLRRVRRPAGLAALESRGDRRCRLESLRAPASRIWNGDVAERSGAQRLRKGHMSLLARPLTARGRLLRCLAPALVLSVLCGPPSAFAADVPAVRRTQEYDLKAVFLYQFAHFVEWPARTFPNQHTPITIGVLG